jgi:dehydrogenase/reductase SDR family member 4
MSVPAGSGQLAGRVALVTGGSRGIGKAIAAAMAGEGAAVVICGRKQEALEEAARSIGETTGRIVPRACHVGRLTDLERLVAGAEADVGPIDILVNNAATNVAQGHCLEMDEGQFDKMVEVNLKSAFRLIRLVAPGMCRRGRGSIINISSIAGIKPQWHGMLYSMTKAALIMMTQSYAQELGPHGVRVNAIAPGLVETVLSAYYWQDPARRQEHLDHQAIKRIAQPEEIAGVAVMLASDGAAYLTGQTVVVDGGRLLGWT